MKKERLQNIGVRTGKYQKIKKEIFKNLSKLENTDQLRLSERRLCEIHRVSRPTIHKALKELVAEKILIRNKNNRIFLPGGKKKSDKIRPNQKNEILILQQNTTEDAWMGPTLTGIDRILKMDDYLCLYLTGSRFQAYDFSRTAGIISVYPEIDFKGSWKNCPDVPIVTVHYNSVNDPDRSIDSIMIDNFWCAENATKYLISLGHRKIGCITGALRNRPSDHIALERLNGFKKALEKAKIPIIEKFIKCGNWSIEDGHVATTRLFSSKSHPTALFACNDHMAIGALSAISDLGLRIPEDVSVVGFDNINTSARLRPSLTTMDSRREEIGEMAGRLLIERIKHPDLPRRNIKLKGNLIIRNSCAPFYQKK